MVNIVKFLYFIDFDKRNYIFRYRLYGLINCRMNCLEKILTRVSFENIITSKVSVMKLV